MSSAAHDACFVGFDVGTQSTKGIVVDLRAGRVVARAQKAYGLIEGLAPGAAEQHPATWWNAMREVAHDLLAQPDVDAAKLAGLAISGQQHGFVALDSDGEVIRPAKLWCDTSTSAEACELSERWGRQVPTGFTASKVLWLQRHEPDAFARLASVLLPHDWINYRLTGRRCTEAGDASGTGFFDPGTRRFITADAASIDSSLPGALPPVLAPDEPVGEITAEAAAELGLPTGLMVAPGGGDNMMSAIGSGAVATGVCVMSLGTSGTVFTYTDQPVVDPEGLIAPFCDSTGGWLPLLCVMNATGVAGEVHRAFADVHPELNDLTRAAERVEPGCGGLVFLPYLMGERVPDLPDATGALLGMRPGHLDPAMLFRAALEGTSLNLAWGVDRMRSLGIAIDSVRLIGGGARNSLWRRILADVLAVPVQGLAEPESAALGAALQAAWVARRSSGDAAEISEVGATLISPDGASIEPEPEAVSRYQELGQRFRDHVARLYGV